MKVFALTLLALVTIGMAVQASPYADKTHEIKAQFVSAGSEDHTITYKEDGQDKETTLPVLGKALENLKNLKPGDNVVLVCQDDEQGNPQGIIEIKPVKPQSER